MKSEPMTLEFLHNLQKSGHEITDCDLVKRSPGSYRITYYSTTGDLFPSIVDASHAEINAFYSAVVKATGYGPKGLSDIIYRDARLKSNESGTKPDKILITLSPECHSKVTDHHMRLWKHYGFVVRINESLIGIQFAFSFIQDPL
jgi:hypothetical protein